MAGPPWTARRRLHANAAEIAADPILTAYAWVLAGHAIVFLFFLDTGALGVLLDRVEPICWPYFQDCWRYRLHSSDALTLVMGTQLVLIVVAGACLANRQILGYWCSMLLLNAFLFAVVSLDYRLRANELYMHFWLNGVFLLWPAKRWAVPLVIVSFYVWAGTLKLNYEWISGAVLYHDLWWIPQKFTWLACTYVVVLEMVVTWGLLARRAAWTWAALAQLGLFHVESLSQIHWFYPALMAAILSWFVIDRARVPRPPTVSIGALVRLGAPRAAYGILALFAAFQLMPFLYSGDRTLSGEGRIFALHMFEARQVCDVTAVLHRANEPPQTVDLKLYGLAPREICDPVVYYNRVENLCRSRATDASLVDVDWTMHIRRTADTELKTIVDATAFCGNGYRYALFAGNQWMN